MKNNLFKNLFAVCMATVALSSCSSGSDNIAMGSAEAIAKIKEVVKANVDPTVYKIYRLEWKEDSGKGKLNNVLSRIDVNYIDKENNDYDLTIELKDGEFVAQEAVKSPRPNYYSYKLTTPLNVDELDAEKINKTLLEGAELVMEQENEEGYELKSVNNVVFSTDPVTENIEKGWDKWKDEYKAKYKKVNQKFELNFIKKDEHDQVIGKRLVTNYYTVSFVVDETGKVVFKQ